MGTGVTDTGADIIDTLIDRTGDFTAADTLLMVMAMVIPAAMATVMVMAVPITATVMARRS
jgi:hypothetical protein